MQMFDKKYAANKISSSLQALSSKENASLDAQMLNIRIESP